MALSNFDHNFINTYRKDQRRPQISDGELEDWQIYDAASHTSDQGRSAEDVALDGIADLDVKAALAAMPEDFRMAVYLADVEGFSYKEIAEIVGVPSGTVMSRLHRGRKLLRASLADYAKDRGFNRGGVTMNNTEASPCDQVLQTLVLYIDNELPSEQDYQFFQSHFQECINCTELMTYERDALEFMKDLLRSSCNEEAPQDLHERIREQITAFQVNLKSNSSRRPRLPSSPLMERPLFK